ncbi:MAG: UPF0158 family protein [Simkaniaceae bacterium]|nr:UPF0158 family protein [Simkaniaceae bacterium]
MKQTSLKGKSLAPQNPLILRFHRLLDAFAKADDEREFYLDRLEGFILFSDLEKTQEELGVLEKELGDHEDRYALIPKMTFYETKKFMEGFVHEKVYDIDTKEKLIDIIQSKEARENFLEFIYDHLTELEKWQMYYHERSRIRIIEWLRDQEIKFVFEEDLDLSQSAIEKLKKYHFDVKVPKDVSTSRDVLKSKSKTYYSNEALNPRPKRGRPPKQVAKVEVAPELTEDLYTTVPKHVRYFLFLPEYSGSAATFSAKFDTEDQLIASLRGSTRVKVDTKLEALSQRLESLRHLSNKLRDSEGLGIEDEEKMFRAIRQKSFGSDDLDHTTKKGNLVSSVAKGLLPKKRKQAQIKESDVGEKKPKRVKSVTQLGAKKKKS